MVLSEVVGAILVLYAELAPYAVLVASEQVVCEQVVCGEQEGDEELYALVPYGLVHVLHPFIIPKPELIAASVPKLFGMTVIGLPAFAR